MTKISTKIMQRLITHGKRFQPVLLSAKSRDVNESDTSIIVTDMLCDIFGYDKYSEITSEHSIRSTFCDLAIKLEGQIAVLIEVKAIGHELKDNYVKQAIDYATNQGVDWVILTNGIKWRVYKVMFNKPVDKDLVAEFDFTQLNLKDDSHLELLFMLAKEGWQKSVISEFHSQKKALDRFSIGALMLSKPVLEIIRRELKRISPDVKIELNQIKEVIENDVLKREVLEGEKAAEANKRLNRSLNALMKSKTNKAEQVNNTNETSEIQPSAGHQL